MSRYEDDMPELEDVPEDLIKKKSSATTGGGNSTNKLIGDYTQLKEYPEERKAEMLSAEKIKAETTKNNNNGINPGGFIFNKESSNI